MNRYTQTILLLMMLIFTFIAANAGEKVIVDMKTSQTAGYFWGEKEKPTVTVGLFNTTRKPVDTAVEITLYDYHHDVVKTWKENITASPDKPYKKIIVMDDIKYGVYEIEAKSGENTRKLQICWLPERAVPWKDSPLGVCVHFAQRKYPNVPWMATQIRDMGASWIRDNVSWSSVERKPGEYILPDYTKLYLDEMRKADLNTLVILGVGNRIYDDGNAPSNDETRMAFANYAKWAVVNLKDYSQAFEIWNETDNSFWQPKPDPEAYAELVKTTYRTVKATPEGKQAEIIGGVQSWFNFPHIESMLNAGMGKSIDAYSMHPYGLGNVSPEQAKLIDLTDKLHGMLDEKAIKNCGIWFTEFGYTTYPYTRGGPQDRVAAYILREYLVAMTRPYMKKLFFYDILDDGNNPNEMEHNFGLMKSDGSAKAGFAAYNTMARMLYKKKFKRLIPQQEHTTLEEFTGANGNTLVAWAVEGAGTLSLFTGGKTISVTDMMGNTSNLTSYDGRISIPLTAEPVFVTGYADLQLAPQLAAINGTITVTPGVTSKITVNADPAVQKLIFKARFPAEWKVEQDAQNKLMWNVTPPVSAGIGSDYSLLLVSTEGVGAGARLWVRDPLVLSGESISDKLVRLNVKNDFNVEISASYQATAGSDVQETKQIVVPASGNISVDIPVKAQSDKGWQCVPVDITVRIGDAWRKFIRIRGGTTPCYNIAPAEIDGEMDEWKDYIPCVINQPFQTVFNSGQNWEGISDLSARFWLASDGDLMTMAAVVTDQKQSQLNAADGMWAGDSIQFSLFANDKRYEFGIAMNKEGNAMVYQWSPEDVMVPADKIKAAAVRIGNETRYEISIPWKDLKITPGKSPLKFSLLVNDDDGKKRKGWIEWFSGIGSGKDPQKYSPVLFNP